MTLFEIKTPTGLTVRTTDSYWERIITFKHPSMRDRLEAVKETLATPTEIRVSLKDENVLLYYRPFGLYFICVVVKRTNGDGFIVTTYLTDKIKEGYRTWPK